MLGAPPNHFRSWVSSDNTRLRRLLHTGVNT
jgi:hypothetical protein